MLSGHQNWRILRKCLSDQIVAARGCTPSQTAAAMRRRFSNMQSPANVDCAPRVRCLARQHATYLSSSCYRARSEPLLSPPSTIPIALQLLKSSSIPQSTNNKYRRTLSGRQHRRLSEPQGGSDTTAAPFTALVKHPPIHWVR